jgi:murein L,D-transpeptidase YcbB/YkuD
VTKAYKDPMARLAGSSILIGLTLSVALLASCTPVRASEPSLAAFIEEHEELGVEGETINVAALRPLYRARAYQPIWLRDTGRLSRAGKTLLAQLDGVDQDGLDPAHFHVDEVRALLASSEAEAPAKLELLLSHLLIHYATDVGAGRLDPKQVDPKLFVFPREIRGTSIVENATRARDLEQYLDGLAPQSDAYRRLRSALKHLRDVARAGGWPKIPDGLALKPGLSDSRTATLRARLRATGELAAGGEDIVFDAPLEVAIKRFQARNGLTVDGVVGSATRAALNVTVHDRIEQIIVNMERLRWLPDALGPDYVVVNIADFSLTAVQGGKERMAMRVVVGRLYRQTPIFVSKIEAIEANPFWTVPAIIAKEDLLPKIIADPSYLVRNRFEVFSGSREAARKLDPLQIDWAGLSGRGFPYKLRQEPGANNALGRYKFHFPNPFAVYLHDTPSRELFKSPQRTFSSGCIRLEDARALASLLLEGESQVTKDALDEAVSSGVNKTFRLSRSLPIVVTYATAWVDDVGVLQLRPDIYGRDAALATFLRSSEESHAPAFVQ